MSNAKKEIGRRERELAEKEIREKNSSFRYDTRDYTLEHISAKMASGTFFIPDYQRNFIWPEKTRRLFIESLFLRLPIPMIFLGSGEGAGKFEIIDGLQRMSTVQHFINDKIVLKDLEKLPSLNGFRFSDLSQAMQEEFKNTTLRTIVLYEALGAEAISDLFKRINTTSVKLSEFEIIAGTCKSAFMDMIANFEKDADFCAATPFTKKRLEKDRRERGYLLLRFFVYLDHYKEIGGTPFEYLKNYAETVAPKLSAKEIKKYRDELTNVLRFVKDYFGPNGLGKSRNRTTRIRFEALAVGIALALREQPKLKCSVEIIKSLLNSKEFGEVTPSGASSNSDKLVKRVEFVRDYLLRASNELR